MHDLATYYQGAHWLGLRPVAVVPVLLAVMLLVLLTAALTALRRRAHDQA